MVTSVLAAKASSAYVFPMKSRLGSKSISPRRGVKYVPDHILPTYTVKLDASGETVIAMKIQAGESKFKVSV